MPFNLSDAQVPSGFSTKDFLLRPIRASDARLDFEAVMESRDFLRLWEQTGWPEDNFTVEENRADLAKMVQRHRDREAFAYTVMDPGETQCLGCVYLFPVDAEIFSRSNIVPRDKIHWADHSAAGFFWVRTSRLTVALDQTCLKR